MSELWTSPLLRRALIEAVLVGAIGGVIGVHVVLRRFSYATAALTHATFPGVVLGTVIGAWWLKEPLHWQDGAAIVLVLLAIASVMWPTRAPPAERPAEVGNL